MMSLVALVAANFAAVRWLLGLEPPTPAILIGWVVLLPFNFLCIGLVRIGRQLVRSGECEPFSVGCQALG
jgi:hypothetical protein